MISSQLISGQSLIVPGLAVVIFVFLMGRTFVQSRKPGEYRPSSRTKEDAPPLEASAEAAVEKLEVRLFDFAREVEARMQTRMTVLDRLIVDADREILRLQDLLAVTKRACRADSPLMPPAEPRSAESQNSGRPPTRQPDVVFPHLPPAAGSEREAA